MVAFGSPGSFRLVKLMATAATRISAAISSTTTNGRALNFFSPFGFPLSLGRDLST